MNWSKFITYEWRFISLLSINYIPIEYSKGNKKGYIDNLRIIIGSFFLFLFNKKNLYLSSSRTTLDQMCVDVSVYVNNLTLDQMFKKNYNKQTFEIEFNKIAHSSHAWVKFGFWLTYLEHIKGKLIVVITTHSPIHASEITRIPELLIEGEASYQLNCASSSSNLVEL